MLRRTSPMLAIILASLISVITFSCSEKVPETSDQETKWTHLDIEVSEVTHPDITISPDGRFIVFTIVGHLFRLSIEGGAAEQLTSGPSFNREPSFSPDGKEIAFVSDRDGSEGNVFILDLASKEVSQITRSRFSGYPSWAPDGKSLLYLEYDDSPRRACPGKSVVKTIGLSDRTVSVLTPESKEISSTFYAHNSSPGWSLVSIEGFDEGLQHEVYQTEVEVKTVGGESETLNTVKWVREDVVLDPAGKGLYTIQRIPWETESTLVYATLDSASVLPIMDVPLGPCTSRFAVTPDGNAAIIGYDGGLWRVPRGTGNQERIPFTARIGLQVNPIIPPRPFHIDDGNSISMVLSPRLSTDMRFLVFGAMGHLWRHDFKNGKSAQLTSGIGLFRKHALSPDGRFLAYVRSLHHKPQIRLLNLRTQEDSLITTGSYFWDLTWDPGTNGLYWAEPGQEGLGIISWDLATETKKTVITSVSRRFPPRPHFSSDGLHLLYRQESPEADVLNRLELNSGEEPESVARLARNISNVLLSPDQKWIAFRRNSELWLRPFEPRDGDDQMISREGATLISPLGGRSFAFTSDGSGIVYSEHNKVFVYSMVERKAEELPVSVEVQKPSAAAVLLKDVHLLNHDDRGFSGPANLMIEDGRIIWTGADEEIEVPQGAEIIDAEGRFVIPGLIDTHVHVEAPWWYVDVDQAAYIAYGVTTVRDMGETLSWVKALVDRSRFTNDPLPRYAYSGELFQGTYPHLNDSFTLIEAPSEVRPEVERHHESGVQFLKSYADLSWDFHLDIVREARRFALPVAAHGSNGREIVRGVTQGYSFLEHVGVSRVNEDVYRLLAESGVYWTPTLEIMGGNIYLWISEKTRLKDGKFCAFFPQECDQPAWATREAFFQGLQTLQWGTLSDAREAGVKILMGTDNPFAPGATMQSELESYTLAGYTPFEALSIATLENARALGIEHDLGTIEAGKLADLVVLDENPLTDIRNTQKIWRVIKGGVVFDPADLTPKDE